jgi:hypothetical protein
MTVALVNNTHDPTFLVLVMGASALNHVYSIISITILDFHFSLYSSHLTIVALVNNTHDPTFLVLVMGASVLNHVYSIISLIILDFHSIHVIHVI